ncbi:MULTISPECIES: DUF4878 domain-containing protein [Pseudomonas]|uniref:DUF4878 domain-containing protein n=1 Tax=Pseudomonas TaxID=286 RepID=UPI00235F3E4D|nr:MULTISPECIES: DUF4878 domain-containing protein [Pseudomonas]WJV25600.1 DUF4878 domain-containing protein [Pseudomonas chlororaphis]
MLRSRLRSTFFLAIAALLISACSGGKPDATIDAFYRAVVKGDVGTASKLVSFTDVPAAKMIEAKGKLQMIVGEMQSRIQANDGLDTLEVLDSQINESGSTAAVQVKLTFKNGKVLTKIHQLVKEDGSWKLLLR